MKIQLSTQMFNQMNSPFAANHAKKNSPLKDMLQQITSDALNGREKERSYESGAQKNQALRAEFDTYNKTEEAEEAFGLDNETLMDLAGLLRYGCFCASNYERELNEFRNTLQSFDKSIQQYESILSGKSELPGAATMDSIRDMLTETLEARSKYIDESGAKLNEDSKYYGGNFKLAATAAASVTGEDASEVRAADLEFHADASDIYGEIDRVSLSLDHYTGKVKNILKSICKTLERRGVSGTAFQLYNRESGINKRGHFNYEDSFSHIQTILASIENRRGGK